jgi:hypothetical protein
MSGTEHFGYTEPHRRFIQRESFEPQANEIPNTAPSWLPGDDYYTNFKVGDPFIKVDQGYARLPGAGYEALHPELKGLDPEDYPDISKLAQPGSLPTLCGFLFLDRSCQFGGMIAEEHSSHWQLHYAFLLPGSGWIDALLSLPIETTTVPSIVAEVNAADWHEREVEDMFGIHFEGHPRLGDFVLHDQSWREGIEPMRKRFSANEPAPGRQLDLEWEPQLIVADPGSFAMPVGPISLMKVKGTDMLGCACCSRKQPSQ